MNYNRTILHRIKNDIYDIWLARFNKIYSDTDWHNVFDFANALKNIYGVDSIDVKAGVYRHYMDGSNVPPYREYPVTVYTNAGTLSGTITCASAGTEDDPFKRYDIVISIWPDTKEACIEYLNER